MTKFEKVLIPPSETEIKADLAVIARQMRRVQEQLRALNAEWVALVARRIELEHAQRHFEVYRTERA